ncbi:MAG: zinc ribbon domain-containing protein [Clostridia bacterium]|nr:zinc ribbon domain-containing protein [Clostridia bacterium]
MYCRHCGKEINENSNFCNHCGKNLTDEANEEENKKDNGKIGDIGCGTFIIGTIIIILILFAICTGISKNDNKSDTKKSENNITQQITYRDARNGDIEVEFKTNLNNLGVDITIHPNCDINGLVVKIKQYDKDGNIIEIFDKHLGNVKEGIEVTTSISLTDFNIVDMFKLGQTELTVYDGKVKN